MEIGAAIFFTDYSMAPTELAVALEERGFDSLWVAEHSHIPVTRRFSHPLGDAALTKEYYDVMDPFVTLSAAAAVTTRLKLGTAVCLVIQRDTIQTAPRCTTGRAPSCPKLPSSRCRRGTPRHSRWRRDTSSAL
jgi:hypothetical protein